MKKFKLAAILVSAFTLACSAAVFADGLEDCEGVENEDGTYSYYFYQGVTVNVDEDFYQAADVDCYEDRAVFYHKASREKYEEEGAADGGTLFTLYTTDEEEDVDEAPVPTTFVGYDGEEELYYYVVYPSDVQAYYEDEDIMNEYQELFAKVEGIVAD